MTVAFGVDLGRKHDSTAICAVERGDDGIVRVLAVHELKRIPFAEQIGHIRLQALRYKPDTIHVDSTGLGLPVVEELQRQLGAIVVPVSFTSMSKADLVSRTIVLLQDRKLRLPDHNRLRDELHSVTRQVTKDGNVLYRVSQKFGFSGAEFHHADLAWSLMLAIRGVPESSGEIGLVMVVDPTSYTKGPVPAQIVAFSSKPREIAYDIPPPEGAKYPIIHRNCGIYGDVVELEDHLVLDPWVRDDGTYQGGEVHDKRTWLRDNLGFPWGWTGVPS